MNKVDESANRAVNKRVAILFERWFSDGDRRTQMELSKKIGISQTAISRIMTGNYHMGICNLYKICKFFDVSADYVLCVIGTAEKSRVEEVKQKIKKLRAEEFMLQMNDHWSKEDYERSKELLEEINRLEKLVVED